MIDFGYQVISEIFREAYNEVGLFWSVTFLKTMAVSLFMLSLFTDLISKVKYDFGTFQTPFSQNKLFSTLGFILIIASYDHLLLLLDGLMAGIDAKVNSYNPVVHKLTEEEIAEIDTDQAWWVYMKLFAKQATDVLANPSSIIAKLFYFVFWVLDNLVYGVFLVERFFMLFVLKLLAPIIFIMAIYDKFRHLFYKWIQLYVGFYLLIIPFFAVIWISNSIYSKLEAQTSSGMFAAGGIVVQAVVIGISFYLKFRLFKKSSNFIYKLLG